MSTQLVGFQAMKVDIKDEDDFPFINFETEPDTYLPPGRLPDGTPVFPSPPCWFMFKDRLILGIPICFPTEVVNYEEK